MYSKDTFGKALCLEHQKEDKKYEKTTTGLDKHTSRIQDLVKNIHKDELQTTEVELSDIKDWINSDMDTWKKALKENIGKELRFQETSMFGNEFRPDGKFPVVGPGAYQRKWYAEVTMENGKIKKVS